MQKKDIDLVVSIIDEWMDSYDHLGTGDSKSDSNSYRDWLKDRTKIIEIMSNDYDNLEIEIHRDGYWTTRGVDPFDRYGPFRNSSSIKTFMEPFPLFKSTEQ